MASPVKGMLIEIGGDTSNLQKALEKVDTSTRKLSRELRGIDSLLKFNPKSTEMLSQKQEVLQQNIKETSEKLAELKKVQELADEEMLRGGNISQENYRKLQREIEATEQKLAKLRAEASIFTRAGDKLVAIGESISNISKKLDSVGNTLTTRVTLPVVALGTAMLNAAKDFESAFTGVEKTVEGTPDQLNKIRKGIKQLAEEIPSSTTEIAAVAEAAGQLGIATDDILSFTKVMIDLGNSTNLSSEEAASALAKFANVTKMSASDYDRLGSTIVALGNNFATTESDIVSMATRLASTGELAGLSQSEILSLATAISSVGIEAEAGGSAMSKLLKKIQIAVETGSDDLQDYAKIAGMTAKTFKEEFGKNAVGALAKFIGGLNDTERNGKSAIAILEEMDLKEVRLSNTILSLANSSDLLNNAVELGNKAWDENTALSQEATKRYQTLESRIKTTKNKLMNLASTMGDKLTPTFNKLLDKVDGLIDTLGNLTDEEIENIIKMGALVAAIGPLIKILATLGGAAGTTIKTVGNLSKAIGNVASGVTTATGQVGAFTKIISALVSPAGLATAAILGVVAASYAIAKSQAEAMYGMNGLAKELDKEKEQWNSLKEARDQNLSSTASEIAIIQNLVNELDKVVDENGKVKDGYKDRASFIIGELNNALGTEISLNGDIIDGYKGIREEVDKLIQTKKVEATLNAYEAEYAQALKGRADATNHLIDLENQWKEANKKAIESDGLARKQAEMTREAIGHKIKEETDLISEYGYTIQNYENLQTASVTGTAEAIDSALNQMSISWEQASNSANESVASQIESTNQSIDTLQKFWSEAKKSNDEGAAEIYAGQIESQNERLKSLYDSLVQETATVQQLTPEQVNAFKTLANQNVIEYDRYVSKLSPEMQAELAKVTGVISSNTSVPTATGNLASIADFMYQRGIQPMPQEQSAVLGNVAGTINSNGAVPSAAGNLGTRTTSAFKQNANGESAGSDFTAGVSRGVQSGSGSVIGVVRGLASSILANFRASLQEHSPSKATQKMAEYFVEGFTLGITRNQKSAISSVEDFANSAIDAAGMAVGFDGMQNRFSSEVIDGTKVVFTTPNINFYVQKMNEENLNTCFNYVNRKLGSQY